MRALVILAHPNPESFGHAIAERVVSTLRECNHDVILHDLYAEGFRTAMTGAEHHAYHSDEPCIDPTLVAQIDELQHTDALIFIYPTWWSSMPAKLKGWLERIMLPGVGFVFNANGKVRPGITNVDRLIGISTYGSPWWYAKLVNDNGRRTLLRSMRLSTGLRTRSSWLALYGTDRVTPSQRMAFLDRCEQRMRKL